MPIHGLIGSIYGLLVQYSGSPSIFKGANMEKPSETEYFFFEWLIIEKNMTSEQFTLLTNKQFDELKAEWTRALSKATVLQIGE